MFWGWTTEKEVMETAARSPKTKNEESNFIYKDTCVKLYKLRISVVNNPNL